MLSMGHHPSGGWSLPLPLTILLFALLALYLYGARKLPRAGLPAIARWRAAAGLTGLLILWAAVGSPLRSLDMQFLSAHMVQHLLLMTIAPASILLGEPILALSRALPEPMVRTALVPAFGWAPLRAVGRFLVNPIVCWLAASLTLLLWHVPAIFAFTLRSPALHTFQEATFLVSGFLFWWPVLQPWPAVLDWPRWTILLYLFLATIPCDILSAYLTFCDRIVYPYYLTLAGGTQLSASQDQQLAGALMWTSVTILYLLPAAMLTVRLLGPDPQNHAKGHIGNTRDVASQF